MIKKFFSGHLLSLIVILFFSIVALWSLISHPFYTSHDGFTHTARIAAYYKIIKDGQFPPRWADNLNAGYGSPIFVYSYPLPYFFGSLLHAVKFSYQDSFRLVIILSTLASAIFMYFWLKSIFGRLASMVGAIFYIWVPYRFLNIYVRGAFAENLAYTFLPLIFLSLQMRWNGLLALATAGLLLSHNVVAAMSVPIIFTWFVIQAIFTKGLKISLRILLSLSAGFLISSFIYAPDLLERMYIQFDQGISYYQNHFVRWWQFFRSPWGFGYDLTGSDRDEMSFQLGMAQLVALVGVLLIFVRQLPIFNLKNKNVKLLSAVFFMGVLFVVIFLMVEERITLEVWKYTPLMKTVVDFPWRFLGITTLAFSFLAAYFLDNFRGKKAIVLALVLVGSAIFFNRNHIQINQQQYFTDPVFDGYRGTSTAASDEYTPLWRKSHQFVEQKSSLTILSGDVNYQEIVRNSKQFRFMVSATGPAVLRINRFYFPETTISVDGKLLAINRDYQIVSEWTPNTQDYTGLIKLFVSPPGGVYELNFSETPIRKASNIASLVSGFLIVILILRGFLRKVQSRSSGRN